MRLAAVENYRTPATDAVMAALDGAGGYWGDPRLFMRELSELLRIDTRLLASAISRLHLAGKIAKYYGGDSGFYIVGISLPDRTYRETDIRGLGSVDRDPRAISRRF
jgi:hypothetical protein